MPETKEHSGVHRLFGSKPRINPKTSPFVPENTRNAFQTLDHHSERMKKFFAETFYFSPGRSEADFALLGNLRDALFAGIQNEDCFVGHVPEPAEGVHDEVLVSTPEALVLFHCEEQEFTRRHTSPVHAAMKFVDPQEGLYIQPEGNNGVYTINFGTVRFNEVGVLERRDYPHAWSRDEEKIWKEHRKRWNLFPANGDSEPNAENTRKGMRVKLFDLLRWSTRRPRTEAPRGNLFVPYSNFQNRIQNINFALAKGLNAINGRIQELSDDPEPGEQIKRY